MKKNIVLMCILAILVMACFSPLSVAAEGDDRNETALVIGYDENNVKVFESLGTYSLFAEERPEIVRLVFSEGVRRIGNLKLGFCPNLTEVVLPSTLKIIDVYAFRNAGAALTDITIPASVGYIAGMDKPRYEFYGGAPFDETVTLHGDCGSYAERYAQTHGLNFEPIVYELSFGDVNADGLCNSTDARLVLQYVVGKNTLGEEAGAFADVNGDGTVTSEDARLCLQYAVEKSESERIAVPNKRASSDLISPQAQVYGFSWPTEDEYPNLPKCKRDTLLTSNRSQAIAIANRMIGTSYYADGHALETLTQFSMRFVEPDGSWVEIQLRRSCGWVLVYNGNVFGDLRGENKKALIDLLR